MRKILPLNRFCVFDLIEISKAMDNELSEEQATQFCSDTPGRLVYGLYDENTLISVAVVNLISVMPNRARWVPNGRIFYISTLFTLPDYRDQGCASALLKAIEADATMLSTDIIRADSECGKVFQKNGYVEKQPLGYVKQVGGQV